jgi:hypothetical protein
MMVLQAWLISILGAGVDAVILAGLLGQGDVR